MFPPWRINRNKFTTPALSGLPAVLAPARSFAATPDHRPTPGPMPERLLVVTLLHWHPDSVDTTIALSRFACGVSRKHLLDLEFRDREFQEMAFIKRRRCLVARMYEFTKSRKSAYLSGRMRLWAKDTFCVATRTL